MKEMAHSHVTVGTVIDLLGGTAEVAALTQRSYKAVWMWRALNKFPAATYVMLAAALAERGYEAPLSLWGMEPPADDRKGA